MITEIYNGTSWTEVNDLNTAKDTHGQGGTNYCIALAYGGYDGSGPSNSANTESWNGSSLD